MTALRHLALYGAHILRAQLWSYLSLVLLFIAAAVLVPIGLFLFEGDRDQIVVVFEGEPLDRGVLRALKGQIEVRDHAPDDASTVVWVPEDPVRRAWRVRSNDAATRAQLASILPVLQQSLRQDAAIRPEEFERLVSRPGLRLAQSKTGAVWSFGGALYWGGLALVAFTSGVVVVQRREEGLIRMLRMGVADEVIWVAALVGPLLPILLFAVFCLGWIPLLLMPPMSVVGGVVWMSCIGLQGVSLGTIVGDLEHRFPILSHTHQVVVMPVVILTALLGYASPTAWTPWWGVLPVVGGFAWLMGGGVVVLGFQVVWTILLLRLAARSFARVP